MKVLVIGGGLIGVTTAYFLRRRGLEVTVIDRGNGVGQETSFANGTLLTPSMAEPWNAPGSWRVLLASLGRTDAAMQLRLRALPALSGWGLAFLRNSSAAKFERNTLSNLRLALYSLNVMQSVGQEANIEYGRTALGTLRVFRDLKVLERAVATADRLVSHGLNVRRLSPEEATALEPALSPIAKQLAGALHYGADEAGDAHRFCVALADCASRQGVEFCLGTKVSSLDVRSGLVTGVVGEGKRFFADRYIVAAGSYSTLLLRGTGLQLPVRPAKGYSVTFGRSSSELNLQIPIVDDQFHAVLAPLDAAIRVAGTAEFAGYDLALPPARIRNLLTLLQQVLPQAQFNPASAISWCGLRAMSADGVPIIGATPVSNLLLNTGHGHLGWTMAAGSAKLLADLVCGHYPAIDPVPYALKRFD